MAYNNNRQESLPNKNGVSFKVGDGVHTYFNGDADPLTVVAVSDSGREIKCRYDRFKVIEKDCGYKEGPIECEFTPGYPEVAPVTFRLFNKDGRFKLGARSPWGLNPGRVYSRNPHI